MTKKIDWQKLWKQRDKALKTLEYYRVDKSVIKQASTLIISSLAKKSNRWLDMRKAKVKVRGYVFGFRVGYGIGWYDEKPSIRVNAYCNDEYKEHYPLVRAIAKEFRENLTIMFNQIDELEKAFIIGEMK